MSIIRGPRCLTRPKGLDPDPDRDSDWDTDPEANEDNEPTDGDLTEDDL
jgi:hypothetical protein